MTGFSHAIAGGSGNLIVTALQSPNFVPAVSGWAIFKNGDAQFNEIILPDGQGVSVFFASSPPVTSHVGDLWYNTGNGLQLSVWTGSAWLVQQFGGAAIANGGIGLAQLANAVTARAIGGITTTIAATAPSNPMTGDIWINTMDGNALEQWDGAAWTPIAWNAVDVMQAGTINASLIQAGTITGSLIAAQTITGVNIAAGTITASQLSASAINGFTINGVTINAGTINASDMNITAGAGNAILVYS